MIYLGLARASGGSRRRGEANGGVLVILRVGSIVGYRVCLPLMPFSHLFLSRAPLMPFHLLLRSRVCFALVPTPRIELTLCEAALLPFRARWGQRAFWMCYTWQNVTPAFAALCALLRDCLALLRVSLVPMLPSVRQGWREANGSCPGDFEDKM